MERYFDAHLCFANWGTHRLMLRIPKARLDLKALKPYFVGSHAARLTSTGEHVLIDLGSDTEEPEYDEQSQGSLAALSPLRAELMRGDLRPYPFCGPRLSRWPTRRLAPGDGKQTQAGPLPLPG